MVFDSVLYMAWNLIAINNSICVFYFENVDRCSSDGRLSNFQYLEWYGMAGMPLQHQ